MGTKKNKIEVARKTKLERIMFERCPPMKVNELQEKTGIANPTLFNIIKGRKTKVEDFRKRTLRDLEKFLGVPPEQFLGWEETGGEEKKD